MHDKKHGHKVQWGTLIAGAAIVAGVVLFAPSVIPGLLEGIGNAITGLFSSTPGTSSMLLDVLKSPITRQAAGAVLFGGGLAYFLGKKDNTHAHHRQDDGSFAINEQMRATDAMMTMRLAYAGDTEAQAKIAQQQRR